MTQILRAKINWTGAPGGPGFTNLYFRDFSEGDVNQAMADGARTRVQTWLTEIRTTLPSSIFTGLDPVMDVVTVEDGKLEGFFNVAVTAPAAGAVGGSFSAASGGVVSWGTNGVRNGRRIRGRTFIVPIGGTMYDSVGTLSDFALGTFRAASTAMLAPGITGVLGVWARPSVKGATDGTWTFATTAKVNDKVAILTSRRD